MINCTSYKSPPLIPDCQHRTIGVADNPGGIGTKEVILQLRPVGSHDDKVAGNFIGEFENFLVHIADPDHGMGSNFGSDVFVAIRPQACPRCQFALFPENRQGKTPEPRASRSPATPSPREGRPRKPWRIRPPLATPSSTKPPRSGPPSGGYGYTCSGLPMRRRRPQERPVPGGGASVAGPERCRSVPNRQDRSVPWAAGRPFPRRLR